MNKKFLSFLSKVAIILAILIICTYNTASAFSFGFDRVNAGSTGILGGFFDKIFNNNKEENSLQNLKTQLENMRNAGNYDINEITSLIDALPEGENKTILQGIKDMFLKLKDMISGLDIKSLLDKLIDAVKGLLGGGSSSDSSLPVEPTSVNMDATTAVEFAGQDYAAKLHASIYKHVDENGNEDSDKWAVLIHPFMLNGEMIASKIGPYYYEKGYNIIAPDLRSFGESEGSVALGFLESLDVYDWLTLLNNQYKPSQVIVHGISLGGATTNFLSGIDQFINNGPTKINTQIKSLRELKVVGLVEDCGYTDMTQFADQSYLIGLNIGLTEENFEYYSNAENSLKYCDIPMLIIQGDSDSIVKPENAETVKNTVKGEVQYWSVEGGAHAFIIIGMNADEYKAHVQSFIDTCNDTTGATTPDEEPDQEPDQVPEEDNNEESTGIKGFLEKILEKLNFGRR